MSEAEIRRAIEEAKGELGSPEAAPSRWPRLRKAAAGAAVGLGLAMLAACYGAPMPRPPQSDGAQQLQPGQLESQLGGQGTPAKKAKGE